MPPHPRGGRPHGPCRGRRLARNDRRRSSAPTRAATAVAVARPTAAPTPLGASRPRRVTQANGASQGPAIVLRRHGREMKDDAAAGLPFPAAKPSSTEPPFRNSIAATAHHGSPLSRGARGRRLVQVGDGKRPRRRRSASSGRKARPPAAFSMPPALKKGAEAPFFVR